MLKKIFNFTILIILVSCGTLSSKNETANFEISPEINNRPNNTDNLPDPTKNITFYPTEIGLTTYFYISKGGSDSNPGTLNSPWETLSYAVQKIKAGDTLFIRGGTYQEYFAVTNSGTLSGPITITNYNGEEVIIDGINNTLPPKNSGTPLIGVYGDWVTIKNLTVRYAGTFAVYTIGSNVTLENLYVHHNWGGGIILSGNHDVLQNSRIWYNSTMNENGQSSSGWGTGASCARYPEYCTIRNNTVWQNWGEGVSTFESMHTNIEGNISYDNHQNFYLSDTKYSTMQRNLSYCTTDNALDVKQTQCGILIGDEKGVPIPLEENGERHPSSDNIIINNLVIGCNHNLAVGTDAINNNLFSNNTLVNSRGSAPNPYNVLFYTGETKNARFENNIIIQNDYKLIGIFAGGEGINFSNNLWSHVPPKNLSGQGDIISDPLFANYGYIYSPNRYILTKESPAINNGIKNFQITNDFFGNLRGSLPDIGAFEYIE